MTRHYRISVTDEATIVPRGERLRIWWVQRNDGWVRARDYPGAVVELGAGDRCPPGMVWSRETELILPVSTLLRAVVSEPAPIQGLEPIEYLRREIRGTRRRVRVTAWRVRGNYRLARAPEHDRGAKFQPHGK